MLKNLELTHGLIFSQSVLLALTQKGMNREDAYRLVQGLAMETWHARCDFRELLKRDPEVTSVLSGGEIDALFDLERSIANIDHIFTRVGLN
jgi:adenylosuccinate lyase